MAKRRRRSRLPRTNVKPTGVKALLWGLTVFVLLNILARFGLFGLTETTSDILTIMFAFFVLGEIGFLSRGRGRLGPLKMFGMVVALLALLGVAISFLGLSIPLFGTIQGFIDIGLGIYVLIEIFT